MSWEDKDDRKDTGRFSEELLESENDKQIGNVANKVSTLKHIALELRTEAKDQVKITNDLGGILDAASSVMGGSFKRIQGLRRTRLLNCKYMWYFALLGIVFILVVYLLVGRAMS